MTNLILASNVNEDYNNSFINSKVVPKLKLDNDIYFSFNNNENYPSTNNTNIFIKDKEINKLNTMTFLFPSIPIQVSIYY